MQIKGLLFASVISLSAFNMQAQTGINRNVKPVQDSSKVSNGPLASASVPFAPTPENTAVSRKPVPLAGQEAYYGSMNDYVNNYVRQYLTKNNRTLSVVQTRSNEHFSVMENVLEKNNIPKELKYLAVIESALNNNAVSHAGAVGPWQLMASTARILGLTVNRNRDERTDVYKSTNAAAKYLGQLYNQLNDWLLVVAAYNSGPVPVQKAIARTGSRNFWDIKQYLPKETQGHVLAFIATASIFEQMSNFIGLGSLPTDFKFNQPAPKTVPTALKDKAAIAKPSFTQDELNSMAIVKLSEPISLDFMAQELSIDRKLLGKWNSDYELFLLGSYPEQAYSIRLPKEKLDKFLEKKHYIISRSKKILEEMAM